MEEMKRKPFQGVSNIVKFNWHFYVFAVIFISLLLVAARYIPGYLSLILISIAGLSFIGVFISLMVSYYIYDRSVLYTLEWLNDLNIPSGSRIITINAGFDETSFLISKKYPDAGLIVYDFYDPTKHTEVSIERARKAYPSYPTVTKIATSHIPTETGSIDLILILLAAHEIRLRNERIVFFKELKRVLKTNGKIVVVEHLRDLPNFIGFNFGFFHFHSKPEWKQTFSSASLDLEQEIKITPFLSTFILNKNGTTS